MLKIWLLALSLLGSTLSWKALALPERYLQAYFGLDPALSYEAGSLVPINMRVFQDGLIVSTTQDFAGRTWRFYYKNEELAESDPIAKNLTNIFRKCLALKQHNFESQSRLIVCFKTTSLFKGSDVEIFRSDDLNRPIAVLSGVGILDWKKLLANLLAQNRLSPTFNVNDRFPYLCRPGLVDLSRAIQIFKGSDAMAKKEVLSTLEPGNFPFAGEGFKDLLAIIKFGLVDKDVRVQVRAIDVLSSRYLRRPEFVPLISILLSSPKTTPEVLKRAIDAAGLLIARSRSVWAAKEMLIREFRTDNLALVFEQSDGLVDSSLRTAIEVVLGEREGLDSWNWDAVKVLEQQVQRLAHEHEDPIVRSVALRTFHLHAYLTTASQLPSTMECPTHFL